MLAREGYSTILVVFLFSILLAIATSYGPTWFGYIIYPALIILCGLILYFFRDPQRTSPTDENLILAPADGRVVLIQKINENEYIGGTATQVSIFLSPLDVHVNRVPVSGDLEFVKYYPGKYLMAWEDHASEMNERAHFGVKHPSGLKILFKQITGFMARRIVYHLKEGENVEAGQRFGIMKFGSRMDVILPGHVDIKVKKGDRTIAGESILAEIS